MVVRAAGSGECGGIVTALELVALVAYPAKQYPIVADARPTQRTGHMLAAVGICPPAATTWRPRW